MKDLDQNFNGFLYKHCSIFSGKALDFHPKLGDTHFYLLIRFTTEKFNFTEIMYYIIKASSKKNKSVNQTRNCHDEFKKKDFDFLPSRGLQ